MNRMWGQELCLCGSGQRKVAGSYAYGNEHLDSIKWEEFIDWLRKY
jgi:hypothetical protein